MGSERSTELKPADQTLKGRDEPLPDVPEMHFVKRENRIRPPFPANHETISFGMGCFWGAERAFWRLPGVYSTAVGYEAGQTKNPTYEEVCTGQTNHNEVVLVVYEPGTLPELLKTFWEAHDSTTPMR